MTDRGQSTSITLPSAFLLVIDFVCPGLWSEDIKVIGRVSCHTQMLTFPSCLAIISPLVARPRFATSLRSGGKLHLLDLFIGMYSFIDDLPLKATIASSIACSNEAGNWYGRQPQRTLLLAGPSKVGPVKNSNWPAQSLWLKEYVCGHVWHTYGHVPLRFPSWFYFLYIVSCNTDTATVICACEHSCPTWLPPCTMSHI